jgi:ribonuclease G
MPKELIVSVIGREKKIAIVENGRTTEFYIERGEGSQGIVGNIYKGRVMRVLPGMQSAFVDIGLERDAFLYVSDFFDEEEEFERIVVDKKKSEGADDESATRAASERIERARVERERQIESAHETADEPEDEEAEAAPADVVVAVEPPVATSVQATEEEQESGGSRRGRDRRRRRGGERDAPQGDRAATPAASIVYQNEAEEDITTPFVAGADDFHRIVDEDDSAAEDGSMFKDARVQERLLDQIHAVEFDMEDTTGAAEVGSLLGAGANGGASAFERVADDSDDEAPATMRSRRSVQPEVAASVARLADEVIEEDAFASRAQSFERVSDDEAVEAVVAAPDTTVAEARGGSKRGVAGRSASKRSGAKKAVTGAAETEGDGPNEEEGNETEDGASKKPSPRAREAAAGKAASKKSASKAASKTAGKSAGKGRARGAKTSETTQDSAPEGGADNASLADAEAKVSTRTDRGEFARRGGRRRRRPGQKGPGEENGNSPVEGAENGDGAEEPESAVAEMVSEAQEAPVEEAVAAPAFAPSTPAAAAPAPGQTKGASRRDNRSERGERSGRGERSERGGGRGERGERSGSSGSSPAPREGRESRDGRGRRERQPTITDLLREGQEIIVQIAKEPIAQKGARITSHIALPGRFLVYMPTIEHVGVSRKIESDSERVRLRKLIQAIVKTEDLPSGGFIVRTAGIGISEQDLRDDARYLIRTWRDIRRAAEKQKAPALSHKDLDLVQRILRDQLSDDFTAIRVDSEEEYQAIVEFVNRIQPRLVNRVKLYTRDEPILEAYGVQAEIDKAIKPRVWLKSGGYLVINQTEALVAIDVNTGKFVGRGGSRLEDTITRTNMEAVEEIARQIRLRDLGGILVLDLIDMEERRNRARVLQALQDALRQDKSPTKVLSFNDFGLVIMTRKRVKQSLERTLCSPCPYCQGAGLVKSPQTICYEVLEEARRLARGLKGEQIKQATLRVNPEVARALRSTERDVLAEIEDHLGAVDINSADHVHQEQFDFAFI